MSVISVNDLTFCYDGSYDDVFEHVSFRMDTDWRLGFVGRNGRGKTTFLNLLMGKYEYRGSISASVNFDYFPFDVPDLSLDTADILASVSGRGDMWRFKKEFAGLGLDEGCLYRPFSTLSHGERTKALISALFLKDNNFLLIDEPTNHLDMHAREVLCEYLKSKRGFILVSHDRAFLDGCTDHTLSINRADITLTRGSFSVWWENKERQDAFETDENERLMGEIHRLSDSVRRTALWSDSVEADKIGTHVGDRGAVGHKAAKMMKRAKAIEKRRQGAIEEKSKLLKNIERNENLAIHPMPYRKERLLSAESLSVSYGARDVLSGLSFSVSRGERIALSGGNGTGKSTVIKLISGDGRIPFAGRLTVPGDLKISYVPQDTSFLRGGLSDFARAAGIDESLFKTILRKLDFERVQFEKDMADFSAGQRKKVLIAKSLCESAHIYIWDEPLNYVDVLSRMQIESLIREGAPTMIFVEHDRAFVENTATRVIELG